MLRSSLIHLLFLFAPTIIYVVYLMAARKVDLSSGQRGQAMRQLPWIPLLGVGLVLVVASLVALAFSEGGDPGQTYFPPTLEDGKIVPARVE